MGNDIFPRTPGTLPTTPANQTKELFVLRYLNLQIIKQHDVTITKT